MTDMNKDRDLYSEELKEMLRLSLKRHIQGEFSSHTNDPIFYTRESYPMATRIENLPLYPHEIPDLVLSWAQLDRQRPRRMEDILVLDLETTGLGRGGTIAIMIGVGYYQEGEFIVEQIFLPDPDAEEHSLDRLRELVESHSLLITFNGKTFDVPVLESRLLYHQIWLNLRQMEHLDLLHLARRLWKRKLPSCALETIEYYILGHIRDKELDIEGGDIPQSYFHFLMTGEGEMIKRVFIHNHHDILHTAALFTLICDSCAYPPPGGMDIRIDYHALAKLYQSQGHDDTAKYILIDLLSQGEIRKEVLYDLGMIYKREANIEGALDSFAIATDLQDPPSMLEYAKLLEKQKQYSRAAEISQRLLELEKGRSMLNHKSIAALEHRIERLDKKLSKG
ncbi:MAG: ribonuclease H-like domain-containing protein [Candidatus Cloacimonetes bacterium]|nr:ribonuclease H-like domain-containing protein [Candidatus Cloacimonadota bacterium]